MSDLAAALHAPGALGGSRTPVATAALAVVAGVRAAAPPRTAGQPAACASGINVIIMVAQFRLAAACPCGNGWFVVGRCAAAWTTHAHPTHAPCAPPAGYLKLDLVSTSGAGCNSNLQALCLSSFRIDIDASCSVALAPLIGNGVYVPGIWSSNPGSTYPRLVGCPTWATAAVASSPEATPEQLQTAIQAALQRHVYGAAYELGISGVAWASGTVTISTVAGGCALKYAITEVRRTRWAQNLCGRVACGGAEHLTCRPACLSMPL